MFGVDLVHDLSFFNKLPHFLKEMVSNKHLKSVNQLLLSVVHFDVKHQYIWVCGSSAYSRDYVYLKCIMGRCVLAQLVSESGQQTMLADDWLKHVRGPNS